MTRGRAVSIRQEVVKSRYWSKEENELYDRLIETFGYQAKQMKMLLESEGVQKTLAQIRTHEQKRVIRVQKACMHRALIADAEYGLLFDSETMELPIDISELLS